jgi:hypothetical protein
VATNLTAMAGLNLGFLGLREVTLFGNYFTRKFGYREFGAKVNNYGAHVQLKLFAPRRETLWSAFLQWGGIAITSGFDHARLRFTLEQPFSRVVPISLQGQTARIAVNSTGALAIESLSRGAERAVLVDRDTRPALGNIERLGLRERAELVRADVERWLGQVSAPPQTGKFDLVFVDAPYRLADRVAQDLDTHLPQLLAAGGRAIVESGAGRPLRIGSLEAVRQRRYGAADVSIYGETGR